MTKTTIRKILLLVIVLVVVRLLVIYTFDYINEKNTSYIEADKGTIPVEDVVQGLTKALILESESHDFYLESLDKEPLTLIYDGSQGAYSIYVNDALKVQNFDKSIQGYTDRVAYYVLDIETSDYKAVGEGQVVKVELRRHKDPIQNPVFYIGNKQAVRRLIDIRIIYNTAMLIGFFLMLILSFLFYRRDQAPYMFITLVISILSFFKSLISGELYVLSHLFNITGKYYFLYDHLTSSLNLFLYLSLIYVLYAFTFKRAYIYGYVIVYVGIAGAFIFLGDLRVYLVLIIIGDIAAITLTIGGRLKKKAYSTGLLIAYNIFAGFNVYTIMNHTNDMKHGHLSSIAFGPQIGSLIFIFVFLSAVIGTYFDKMKTYEQQQIDFERVRLLRGISHDLKLPLSVIRLNNQMIGRYALTEEEKADYTKSSIEATEELQEMTDNINCYLNMNSPVHGENKTSVRDSFVKLDNHYRSRAHSREEVKVNFDDEDYLLPIDSLEFERMLYNLIDNAFKYNRDNNQVTIGYAITEKVLVVVEDKGIGMSEKEIENIFEPFYKTDHSRSKEGFGLGLSVVQGVVKKLKGEIRVESTVGIGTKISIVIPK